MKKIKDVFLTAMDYLAILVYCAILCLEHIRLRVCGWINEKKR